MEGKNLDQAAFGGSLSSRIYNSLNVSLNRHVPKRPHCRHCVQPNYRDLLGK